MDYENIVMELIVNSGDARSLALEALREARKGQFESADAKIQQADTTLAKTHNAQTELIQTELNGGKVEVSLLVVHAQDHLMNALTVIDLVKELIEMLKDKHEASGK